MKQLRQENGYSLLLALFAIMFLSIIGFSLLTLNTNSMKISKNEEIDQSAYYVAEAGLNVKLDILDEIANQALLATIADRQSEYEKKANDFNKWESINPHYCQFNFTYNFNNNYRKFFAEEYAKQLSLLEDKFEGFPITDSGNKWAKFSIKESIKPVSSVTPLDNVEDYLRNYPNEQVDEFNIEIESSGTIQNKNRKLTNVISIVFDDRTHPLWLNGTEPDCYVNPPSPLTGGTATVTPPSSSDLLISPSSNATKVGVYLTSGKASDICPKNVSKDNICNRQGNRPSYAVGSIDTEAFSRYLPTPDEYLNAINTLKAANNGVYMNQTTGTYTVNQLKNQKVKVNAGETLTLIVDNLSMLEKLEVEGGGTLNIIVNGTGDIDIKGTITSKNTSKINLILEGTPSFSSKTKFDYSNTNIIALNSKETIDIKSQNGNFNGGNLISNTKEISFNASSGQPNMGICTPDATFNAKGTETFTSIVVNEIGTINGNAMTFKGGENPCGLISDLVKPPTIIPGIVPTPRTAPTLPIVNKGDFNFKLDQTIEI